MTFNTISPNMSLPIATVGVEPGPLYAYDVNNSLTLVDQHDHSPGKGVQITPAGININTSLVYNNNSASGLSAATFIAQSSASSVIQSLSVAPGVADPTIQNLWYTDSNGAKVQITQNGTIIPGSATVTGINYLTGTFTFTQAQSGFPNLVANLASGPITIYPASTTLPSTHHVTLSPASGIVTSYNIQLPSDPGPLGGNPAFLTLNSSGDMLTNVSTNQGITNSMLATNTIIASNVQNGQLAIPYKKITVTDSPYAVQPSDGYIEVDSSGGAVIVNLYQVTGFAARAGLTLLIKKTSSDTNVVTINASGPDQIDGTGSTTINTQQEAVELVNNGSNWVVEDRYYPTGWIDAGAITFNGTGSDPGSVGTIVTNHLYWRRIGNTMVCRIQYRQSSGRTAGTGQYLIKIPTGYTIDTSQVAADTTTTGGLNLVSNVVGTMSVIIGGGNGVIGANAIVYDTTHVSVQGFDSGSNSVGWWGQTFLPFSSTTLSCNGVFQVPIVGWN